MNDTQRLVVQETFRCLAPSSETVGAIFYANLFRLNPDLRSMFRGDIVAQSHKLVQVLALAVNSLDRLPQLAPVLEDLGRRHAGYGVSPADYDTVGTALLVTLDHCLGTGFTTDVRDAWAAIYSVLSGAMQRGANQLNAAAHGGSAA